MCVLLGTGMAWGEREPGTSDEECSAETVQDKQGAGTGQHERGPEGKSAVQQGVNDYPLADPRLAEVPNDGNS